MNTTTFTIESVHGVKQTFVLGIPAKPASEEGTNRQPSELDSKPVARDSADGHSPR